MGTSDRPRKCTGQMFFQSPSEGLVIQSGFPARLGNKEPGAEETTCTVGNQQPVMAVEGLRLRHIVLISEKGQSQVGDRETQTSHKGKMQGAQRVSSPPIILSPSFHLSRVQQDLHVENQTLQPPKGM